MKTKITVTIALLLLLSASFAIGQHSLRFVEATWDYYPDHGSADAVAFRLYWGYTPRTPAQLDPKDPHPYIETKDIPDIHKVQEYFDVVPAQTVYCALTAIDGAGNESAFSNEGSSYVPPWPLGRPILEFP